MNSDLTKKKKNYIPKLNCFENSIISKSKFNKKYEQHVKISSLLKGKLKFTQAIDYN